MTHHIPKGVSLDTLLQIVAGWSAVGAAAEPKYTSTVEDATDIADAVGRQTRFLEELGLLEPEGQQHRLTDRGQALAGAVAVEDEVQARKHAREALAEWPVTVQVRGIVRENPTAEADLVPLVAAVTGQDLDADRVRSGLTTLLELYDWAGLLDRDEEGRYRLPETERAEEAAAEEADDDVEGSTEGEENASEKNASEEGNAAEEAPKGTVTETEPAAEDAEETGEEATEEVEDAAAEAAEEVEGAAEETAESAETAAAELGELPEGVLSDLISLVDEVESAAEETKTAAEKAEVAAETAQEAATGAGDDEAAAASDHTRPATGQHALTLGVDLDADAESLEALIRGIRRGIVVEEEQSPTASERDSE